MLSWERIYKATKQEVHQEYFCFLGEHFYLTNMKRVKFRFFFPIGRNKIVHQENLKRNYILGKKKWLRRFRFWVFCKTGGDYFLFSVKEFSFFLPVKRSSPADGPPWCRGSRGGRSTQYPGLHESPKSFYKRMMCLVYKDRIIIGCM